MQNKWIEYKIFVLKYNQLRLFITCGHNQTVHSLPLIPTHPHPPKIFSHPPSPSTTENNAPLMLTHPKYFRTHSHPPKIFPTNPYPPNIMPHRPIPTFPKVFSQPLPPTQNNTPTTPQLPKKFLISSPANLICSLIQNSSSTVPNDSLITRLSNLTN